MLVDTSAIVEIFKTPEGSHHFRMIMAEIGDEDLYVSMVELAEIADWAIMNGAPPDERVAAVKEIARIVPLDERICQDAAPIKLGRREAGHGDFGLIDGIILATARSVGQRVLTMDKDFSGEGDCVVLATGRIGEGRKEGSLPASAGRGPRRSKAPVRARRRR